MGKPKGLLPDDSIVNYEKLYMTVEGMMIEHRHPLGY